MATAENVNIEINQKLLDELAALKAENMELKSVDGYVKLLKENERLKEDQKLWVDYYNTISKLQADKAELLEALKQFETSVKGYSIEFEKHYRLLISKHDDTQRPD